MERNRVKHKLPAGIATGLGSTPFREAAPALAMIRRCMPVIPHWPQLPQRGVQEGLIFQAFRCLVETGLIQVTGDQATFNTAATDWPERLTEFYTICLEAEQGAPDALAKFAFSPDAAAGFTAFIDSLKSDPVEALMVKGQVVGPLTMGFRLKDGDGNLAFYNEQLRDLVNRTLAMHASWQCARLAETGLPVLLIIDDPTVAAYGTHAHIALQIETILDSLDAVIGAIHRQGAMAGIHSCDATDWSLLFATGTDIVSFDAYRFSDSITCYASELQGFLERGGRVAWGIVP
ncbi:MAG: hypothetical protein GY697_25595, partial [Desulfobacterales bacterium]|nr:hypothetical protein [Desulfobacterales bacterium]